MTSARPILFSAPMIRALVDGTKTQTRRLAASATKRCGIKGKDQFATYTPSPRLRQINGMPEWFVEMVHIERGLWDADKNPTGSSAWYARSPWGGPGDLLWVRETWADDQLAEDNVEPYGLVWGTRYRANDDIGGVNKWRPAIFMPRRHSRLTLTITDARIERLHDISEEDAIAEGAKHGVMDDKVTHRCRYARIWDQINGPGAWAANPWVVALTFTVHHTNIDAFLDHRTEAA